MTQPPLEVLPNVGLLVGDERIDESSAGNYDHIYAATGTRTTSLPLAGVAEMDAAVAAARRALPVWTATPLPERRNMLLALAELIRVHAAALGALQTLESSVPARFAASFPAAASDFLDYYAGWADKIGGDLIGTWRAPALDYAIDEPYGVVGIIIPWNGPMVSFAQIAGAALAAGNTVVLKPPEAAPFTSLRLGELALEAGFPPGVVNIVPAGPVGGEALVRHPGVDKVHFTGSGATARKILDAAKQNLTPVGLELGGKSAHLVFADTNVRLAARQVLAGLVIFSGQGCANGTRVLVQAPVYDEVLKLAAARVRHLPVGDPFGADTFVGPVISGAACHRIGAVIERARDSGSGRLVCGGSRIADDDRAAGYFIEPTIFAEVDSASELAQEEIFGPVLSFMKFDTDQEAVALANDSQYGLAAYLHTNDLKRAHTVSRALEVGNVWVNGFEGISPSIPFGGVKRSGFGRIGGFAGLREFTRQKNVWISL
ncbi:aldehyde dehydrogenase family protein [Nocardia sp. NPDC051321]|uniref:aldehyde dehydrogenase family protein n=1 Tax=Nocardia sp. NPDC051321 TaxID=3364323 RepID=UPI0037B331F5